jgi:hypothetical protein
LIRGLVDVPHDEAYAGDARDSAVDGGHGKGAIAAWALRDQDRGYLRGS